MTKKQRNYIRKWQALHPEKVKAYAHANYIRHRRRKLREHSVWREKNAGYMAAYHKRNAPRLLELGRDRAYKRKFGISLAQYNTLLREQRGRCALCLRLPKKVRLAVDHNHKTGKVRGLLCTACNRVVVGRVDTVPNYLERLIRYVQP